MTGPDRSRRTAQGDLGRRIDVLPSGSPDLARPGVSEEGQARMVVEGAFTPTGEAAAPPDDPLSPRIGFLQRLVGEGGIEGEGLRTIVLACLGRPRKEPLFILLGRSSVPAEADVKRVREWFTAEMRTALEDHAPVAWRTARRSERQAIETARGYANRARLRIKATGTESRLEIYLLAGSTVERVLRRARAPLLLDVSFLLMPRLRRVPLASLVDGPPFGRLVAVGAGVSEPLWPTHRRDAADRWPIYVKICLRSPDPIPPDVKEAIAADVRGATMLASGSAAAVDAEWERDANDSPDTDLERVGVGAVDLREAGCLLCWNDGRAVRDSPAGRLREVSKVVPAKGVVIGHAAGTRRSIAIPPEAMFEHLTLNGGSGVGKSVTMAAILRSARDASWARDGVDPGHAQIWLFDPHSSTAAAYAAAADPGEDLIYWDASDPATRWDFFGSEDPFERLRMVDPFVASQWEQWDPTRSNKLGMGPRAEQMLRATATAVASHPRATLANAYDLLHDEGLFNGEYRPWVSDSSTLTWFDMWWSPAAQRSDERADLLSYFSSKTAVLSEAGMRRLWGPPGIGLNIRAAMRSGASVLVVVRRSDFGPVRTATLIRLMKRCLGPELTARDPNDASVRPVIVATDEAAAYETQLDREWLAEMRKHRVCIILAFQDLLGQASPELVDSVSQNAAHLICWRSRSSSSSMARLLGDPEIAADLMTLGRGRAVARLSIGAEPTPPILIDTPKPVPFSRERFDAVRDASRVRYGEATECPAGEKTTVGAGDTRERAHEDLPKHARSDVLAVPLTATAALEALKDEGVSAVIDDDGDVLIDGVGPRRFWLIARGGDVRFYALERCRARSSQRARVTLANRINDALKIVRASVDADPGTEVLVVDWYLPSEVAYARRDLVEAVRRFATLLSHVRELDTQRVLAGVGRATASEVLRGADQVP